MIGVCLKRAQKSMGKAIFWGLIFLINLCISTEGSSSVV